MKPPESTALSSTPPRLIALTDWPKHHEWPPIGGLRHLMFHRASNGFATAFVKVGRRVLVNEQAFFNCIAQQGGSHGTTT